MREKDKLRTDAESHFDAIADSYDYWKDKNWYYYRNLKALLRSCIPEDSNVLEVGCGTGDLLESLSPRNGLGIDISEEMVDRAKVKHANDPHLVFARVDLLDKDHPFSEFDAADFDYIFMSDVLEHVEDNQMFLDRISSRMHDRTELIVTLANPLWEPILMLAEKLHMKMPEGPHRRLSIRETELVYRMAGLTVKDRGYRLLMPKRMPFSDYINKHFHKSPLLSRLGFVVFWVLKRA
jgi:2-polyprenyl-3-methyl-5-hydroxy-6-metoxy-1,4-benzoquinol methylase